MAKTDVKLYSIDTYGKATTATISDVNPDATNSQLVQMGRLFNNLTDNTYSKTDRINTINCDTESGGGKQTPTLEFRVNGTALPDGGTADCDPQEFVNKANRQVYYDGDGQPYAVSEDIDFLITIGPVDQSTHLAQPTFFINKTAGGSANFTINAPETENYKAVSLSFTMTAH